MKNLFITFAFLFLVFARPAFASDDVINYETGSVSKNNTSTFKEVIVKTINSNSVNITNTVDLKLDTGNNEASFNTGDDIPSIDEPETDGLGGGIIKTGSASISVVIENNINKNETNLFSPEEEEVLPEPVTPDLPIGGGEENLKTAPIGGGDMLPSAGPDDLDRMAALLGLPLIGAMLIRISEVLKKKSLA